MKPDESVVKARASEVSLGVYTHFKGGKYTVIGVARHSETLDEMVIYVSTNGVFVRPIDSFLEWVLLDNINVPRFRWDGVYREVK